MSSVTSVTLKSSGGPGLSRRKVCVFFISYFIFLFFFIFYIHKLFLSLVHHIHEVMLANKTLLLFNQLFHICPDPGMDNDRILSITT